MKFTTTTLLIFLLAVGGLAADENTPSPDGNVQIPLDVYNNLVNLARAPDRIPLPPPAQYAIGTGSMSLTVTNTESSPSAVVTVNLPINVLVDEWTAVPILPSGTAVQTVTIDNKPAQLVSSAQGLMWSTNQPGAHTVQLVYRVDAIRSNNGFTLAVPAPSAAALSLTTDLPGTGLDVAVIPAAGTRSTTTGSTTRVTATIPSTTAIQISWHAATTATHTLGRASYRGELVGRAMKFTGKLEVELFADHSEKLPLLPRSSTLREITVDGKAAPIMVDGSNFATIVRGRGKHEILVSFEVQVAQTDGPPSIDMILPAVPVSQFTLILPGKKELTVQPAANVTTRIQEKTTTATFHVPMSNRLGLSWTEAVPESIRTEVRANAVVYHAVHAEEGVLTVHAIAAIDVNRGSTSSLAFDLPDGVQVNRVTSPSGAVSDWRVIPASDGTPLRLEVFLDRQLEAEILINLWYDRTLDPENLMQVPLLRATSVQRQRGMVALLSGRELTLKPEADGDAARVGANQLPAFVRETIDKTIAHTFKYVDLPQQLTVRASPPDRQLGRFDAQIDTLISLGEVSLRGATTIEINIKSGAIDELELALPKETQLLSLAGPSLRTHEIEENENGRIVTAQFTQPMEGSFRLEVGYERILVDSDSEVEVPSIEVIGAEVAQGRLAIEALSAAEVQASVTEQLSVVDVAELPQQLVLRTTNPILMAYKYVHSEPAARLVLKVDRHRVLGVQEAAIDEATYSTLFTRDGLAVTTARFLVRNSRKQFLRIELPEGSSVWSVFVDGRPEKPAHDESEEGEGILIKIVNSTRGFPVQLVYATDGGRFGGLGAVRSTLARPDILVTQTFWDVYLPTGMRYGEPRTNMEPGIAGVEVNLAAVSDEVQQLDNENRNAIEPLRLQVPATGLRYSFSKLYANQADESTWFRIAYASGTGASIGRGLSLLGALLLWAGVFAILWPPFEIERRWTIGLAVTGAVLLAVTVGVYHVGLGSALVLWVLLTAAAAGLWAWKRWQPRRIAMADSS